MINEKPAASPLLDEGSTAMVPCPPTGENGVASKSPSLSESCRDGRPRPPPSPVQSSNESSRRAMTSLSASSIPTTATMGGGVPVSFLQSHPDASQHYSFTYPLAAMGYAGSLRGGDGGSNTPSLSALNPLQLLLQYHQQYQHAGNMLTMLSYNEALMRGMGTCFLSSITSVVFLRVSLYPHFSHQHHDDIRALNPSLPTLWYLAFIQQQLPWTR